MARIIYKPTCSECGTVLHGDVSCTYYKSYAVDLPVITHGEPSIEPLICPNCGVCFTAIIVPRATSDINFDANMDSFDSY